MSSQKAENRKKTERIRKKERKQKKERSEKLQERRTVISQVDECFFSFWGGIFL